MSCEITERNGLPVARTHPSLMQSILLSTDFNIDRALDLYGVTMLDDFKALEIKNPTLENVLNFIEQDNKNDSSNLNKKDRQLMLDVSLQSSAVEDLKTRFLEAFEVQGKFGINPQKLRESGLFSDLDIMYLLDAENLRPIQNLYYKLSQTEEQFDSITSDTIIRQEGLSKLNPDEFEQNALNFYLGLTTTEQILNQAEISGDTLITDNPSLAQSVLNIIRGKSVVTQYETDEYTGAVVAKIQNDALVRLEQTLDLSQNFEPLLNQVEFLRALSPQTYIQDLSLISDYVRNLVQQAQDLGLDINQLEEIYDTKSVEELQSFWDSVFNFLLDLQNQDTNLEESLEDFAQTKNDFFQTQPQSSQTWTTQNTEDSTLLHLETNRSEESLYQTAGLVRVGKNLYQKVSEKSQDSLYDLIFRNSTLLPKTAYSVRVSEQNQDIIFSDIDKYISNQAQKNLRPDSNIDILKSLEAYKLILGTLQEESNPVTGDLRLNPQNFLIEFNRDMLKNPELGIFYISNRGLESNQVIGDYTLKQLQNNLSDRKFRDLVKYAKLSRNESLEPLTSFFNDLNQSRGERDYLANNLEELEQFSGEYYRDSGYVVANSQEDFLKIESELYENVEPQVYARVQTDSRYLNSGLEKPQYNGSVIPRIKLQEGGNLKTTKTKKDNETIEFC